MSQSIKQLQLSVLKENVFQKQLELDRATEQNKPQAELNQLYKELKSMQQELNLRKLESQP